MAVVWDALSGGAEEGDYKFPRAPAAKAADTYPADEEPLSKVANHD